MRLVTANVCQSPTHVDRGDGVAAPCRRPLWGGDGHANMGGLTFEHPMCSRCWHMHQAFHGVYVTMKANPAASTIDNEGLARLFISRGLDAEPLPEVGSERPWATFPAEWTESPLPDWAKPQASLESLTAPDCIPDWMQP